MNLNQFKLPVDTSYIEPETGLPPDHSLEGESISVYFRNLKERLIEKINQSDGVFGCVAWLTDNDILDALAKKHVSIVIQKEDFLRPDVNSHGDWHGKLREKYSALKSCREWEFRNITSHHFMEGVSSHAYRSAEAIRCCGILSTDKRDVKPRMHNKFLVFVKNGSNPYEYEGKEYSEPAPKPYAVWTGSFNLTYNASLSFENAVYIQDATIADAYLNEWGNVYALSEELNWRSTWINPDFRIGT